jgi:hypothetical protein
MNSTLGSVLKASGIAKNFLKNGELIPPLAFGLGPSLIPRPVKLYVRFGTPVTTENYKGLEDDLDVQWKIRMEIEKTMNEHFRELMEYRKQDDKKTFLQKWFEKK